MSESGPTSRLLPGCYPPPGTDAAADHIRARRGARGLLALDANVLHFPAGATGYSDLLGALRTGGKLDGGVREGVICRIAAWNGAAYEWIQHERVGRAEGLSTAQLYVVRDVYTPFPPASGVLPPLLEAALRFTDALTLVSGAPFDVQEGRLYKDAVRAWVAEQGHTKDSEELVDELYAETAMLVATYNLVSRFLVGTDVAGYTGSAVPWPLERVEHTITLPSYPTDARTPRALHTAHVVTLEHGDAEEGEDIPWLVLCNSLLTSTHMWGWVVPLLLNGTDMQDGRRRRYNLLLHDQRGHGRSTIPSLPPPVPVEGEGEGRDRRTTIPLLAWDVQNILSSPEIRDIIDGGGDIALKPVHAVIGVSQGGACALAFGAAYGESDLSSSGRRTKSIITCDTAARTPAGNRAAWNERIASVLGHQTQDQDAEYARRIGLPRLADVTLPRWFPAGGADLLPSRAAEVRRMIERTDVRGFVEGARALGEYDLLIQAEDGDPLDVQMRPALLDADVPRVLLLAGSRDGGGNVGRGLEALCESWQRKTVEYKSIEGAGHLPMVDQPEEWARVVLDWLAMF